MNHWSTLLTIGASIVVICTGVWAIVRWWHGEIIETVTQQLKSSDNAVNHRKEGEPTLVKMVEETLEETKQIKTYIEAVNIKIERHLGWNEGQKSDS